MGVTTAIEWCHHSWSPWRGCTKVSAGCAHCYAEAGSKRNPKVLGIWGPNGSRPVASNAGWQRLFAWDAAAKEAGERRRTFPSLCDPFEDWAGPMVDSKGRALLFDGYGRWAVEGALSPRHTWRPLTMRDVLDRYHAAIALTPYLDHLLLTKRPERAVAYYDDPGLYERVLQHADHYFRRWRPELTGTGIGNPARQRNRWAGASVEDQATATQRTPHLLATPAAVRFLSCEPLLGPIQIIGPKTAHQSMVANPLHWVIIGGESGPKARRCDLLWIKSLVRQCQSVGVAVFVKQLGACASDPPNGLAGARLKVHADAADLISRRLVDPKGGDLSEFPEDLRVREFPLVGSPSAGPTRGGTGDG